MAEYDFSDPNYDFAGRAEILARALKRSQALQATPLNGMTGEAGIRAMSGPDVGAFLSRAAGQIDQGRAEQEQSAMNNAQLQRYDELSRQINAPGTKVLKKTLGNVGPQEDGTALPGAQVEETVGLDYSNPDDLTADNARRMGIAGQMMKLNLPQAQKVGQDYLTKGATFPETLAKMRMDQIEKGDQKAKDREEKYLADLRHDELVRAMQAAKGDVAITVAGMRGGGGDSDVSYQKAGFTPDGKPVAFNPKTGMNYVDGKPYVGDVSSGADYSKGGMKRTDAAKSVVLADNLIAQVEKNPDSFGVAPSIAANLPNFIGNRLTAKVLTPEQREARNAVAQQAAMVIHEIYGAALSAGESKRANSWAWNPDDNYETTMSKLKQARAWAAGNAARTGRVGASPEAAPSGGTPAADDGFKVISVR